MCYGFIHAESLVKVFSPFACKKFYFAYTYIRLGTKHKFDDKVYNGTLMTLILYDFL